MNGKKHPPQNKPLELTPEQEEMVREAIEAKKNGEPSFSAEEVLEYARAKIKTWLPDRSA
jgi:hypothetical protein